MIITIEETSNLAFPVGCPVLHFAEKEGRVILSNVRAVQLDLASTRENLILLARDEARFPERLIQYAPSCPVWFQNGNHKEQAVILSSNHSSATHLEDLNYSLKTIVPNKSSESGHGAEAPVSVHNGVKPEQLSYRTDDSNQCQATPKSMAVTLQPVRPAPSGANTVVTSNTESLRSSRGTVAPAVAVCSTTTTSDIKKASPRDVINFASKDDPVHKPCKNNHKRPYSGDESGFALTYLELPGWVELERVQKILNIETLQEIENLSGCSRTAIKGHNDTEGEDVTALLGENNSIDSVPNEAIQIIFAAKDKARNMRARDIALCFFKQQMKASEYDQLQSQLRTWTIDVVERQSEESPSKKRLRPTSLESENQELPSAEVPPVIEINRRHQETGSPFSESIATQRRPSVVRRSIKLHVWISDFVALSDLEEMEKANWQQIDGSVRLNFVENDDLSISIESDNAETANAALQKCQDDILRKLPHRFRGQLLFHWALDRDDRLWSEWHKDFYSIVPVRQRSVDDPAKTVFMTVISVDGSKTGYIVGSGGGTLKKIEDSLGCKVLVTGNNHTNHPFVHIESTDKRNLERACNRILELISSAGRPRGGKTKSQPEDAAAAQLGKHGVPQDFGPAGYYGPQAEEASRAGALDAVPTEVFEAPLSCWLDARFRDLFLPKWCFSNATAAMISNDRARLESSTSCSIMVEKSPENQDYPIHLRLDSSDCRVLAEGVERLEKYCLDLITTSNVRCAQENLVHLQNRLLYEFAAQRDYLLGVKNPWVVRQKMLVRNKIELVYGLIVLLCVEDPKEVGAILGHRGIFHKRMQKEFNTKVCVVDHASFHSPFCFISGQQVSDVEWTARRIDDLLAVRRGSRRRQDVGLAATSTRRNSFSPTRNNGDCENRDLRFGGLVEF